LCSNISPRGIVDGDLTADMSTVMSLSLREEDTLRVFENRVLRRIFEPKRDEVVEDWRRLHNECFTKYY
jgi:hypothetical protein